MHQVAVSPEWRDILKVTEWYFVPVANPDGYAYSFSSPRARYTMDTVTYTNC